MDIDNREPPEAFLPSEEQGSVQSFLEDAEPVMNAHMEPPSLQPSDEDAETIQKSAEVRGDEKAPRAKSRKRGGFFKKLGRFLLILLFIILLSIAGLIIYSLLDRESPARHIADGYYALVTVSSASDTLQKGLYLSAIDSLLSSPETAALQGNLRVLRSNAALQSEWFKRLLNIPIDAAFYENKNAAFIADIGIRSAATRLLPLVTAVKPELLTKLPNVLQTSFEINGTERDGFLFELTKEQRLYICFYKNLLIAATSRELFDSCLNRNAQESGKRLAALLGSRKRSAVSIYAEPSYLTADIAAKQNTVGKMLQEVSFPEPAALDAGFDEKTISFHSAIKWISESSEVNAVLQRRSTLPAILSRLPEGTVYLTLLNLGDLQFLYENTRNFFTPDLVKSFASAEKNCKLFFNKNLNQLVFDWMGSEIGMFGHRDSQAPVFFVSLKDEAQCRYLLEDLFNTIFLNRSVSAVVDGSRIPRIVFPSWLSSLLKAFRIDLPEPFYMIQDGYLYLSKSAEALGMCKNESDTGKLLVKTEQWRDIAKAVSAETSFLVYYSLGRSVPFFMEQNTLFKTALKNYGKGVLSLRFAADRQIYLDFYTQKTDARKLEEIPAFPRTLSERPDSDVICAMAAQVPYVFWTSGTNVHSMNLVTGEESALTLDGKAGIAADIKGLRLQAVWAVSARGSIYKTDERLLPFPGYPVLTAEKLQPKPVACNGGAVIPLASEPALLFADAESGWVISDEMNAKLKTAPVVLNGRIAALPRSFESRLFMFDQEGKIPEGYPIELDGIFAVEPVFFEASNNRFLAAFLSEDGRLSICDPSRNYEETASCELNAVCKSSLLYAPSVHAFFTISQGGRLFKIGASGEIIDSLPLKTGTADDYRLTLLDLNGDGKDELLVSGGGNAIYAYTSGLTPLDGFPVAGTGTSYLLDIDGDSYPELITHGIDSKIHAYKGAALQ